jgi:hypothetical protein
VQLVLRSSGLLCGIIICQEDDPCLDSKCTEEGRNHNCFIVFVVYCTPERLARAALSHSQALQTDSLIGGSCAESILGSETVDDGFNRIDNGEIDPVVPNVKRLRERIPKK